MRGSYKSLLFILILNASGSIVLGQAPVGSEFQVNTYTTDRQVGSKVGIDAQGDFVVVWTSMGSGGSDDLSFSIQGQRFGSDGSFRGSEFQVNSYTPNDQTDADVATLSGGDFVVVWTSNGSLNGDYSGRSIQAQRYTSNGTPLDAQFRVNTQTTYNQWFPSIAADSEGDFVVVWQSYTDYPSMNDIKAQRFASDGIALGSEFMVNTYTEDYQKYPEITVAPNGDFVIVWVSRGSFGGDTSGYSIQGQRYGSNGNSLGTQFQVNSYTEGSQDYVDLAVDPEGDFVVVWPSDGSGGGDNHGESVQAQRFASGGGAIGPQFQVNEYTTNAQDFPTVAMDSSGAFVITWSDSGAPETNPFPQSVQGRTYSSLGDALGSQFLINTSTTGSQFGPTVAAGPDGAFVVVWNSYSSAGTDDFLMSVQGQRFRAGFIFGDGFESGDTSAWSATAP